MNEKIFAYINQEQVYHVLLSFSSKNKQFKFKRLLEYFL